VLSVCLYKALVLYSAHIVAKILCLPYSDGYFYGCVNGCGGWSNIRIPPPIHGLIFQNPMDDMNRIPPAHCTKVFVHRDYSEGTSVRFQTKFPQELDGKVSALSSAPSFRLAYLFLCFQLDRAAFEHTMTELNNMYASAESLSGRTYCESCLACLTAYLAYLCIDTHYEKV
jgi:hypothetical protein